MGDCFEAKEIAGDVVMVRQRGEEIAGRWTRVRKARRAIGESNWDILGGVRCAICFPFRCREYRDRIELAGGSGWHVIGWVGVALLVSLGCRRSWPRCFSLPEASSVVVISHPPFVLVSTLLSSFRALNKHPGLSNL